MAENVRARVFFVVRVVLTAAMLAALLPRLDPATLFPDRHLEALLWMSGAAAMAVLAVVLSSVRWQQMLHALELPSGLPALLSHTLAGLFVSNFLPTTVGGDVVRATRLSVNNGHRKVSAASVVLERLTGFVSLPLIALVALVLDPGLLRLGTASHVALALTLGPLAAVVLFLAVAADPRLGARLGRGRWLGLAMTVHLGLVRLRRHPASACAVMAAALAYQLTIVVAAWMAAHALGISVGWTAMMAFMPVVAIAQAVPLSIGGLGLREGSLVLLLGPLGVAASHAVALGLTLYGINMLVSLLGAPAFLVGSRRFAPVPAYRA
ncbi:MAG TPA: lysylphosphatidylglycerol synthase transmembrane domain-containing protein [Acidimicrobiales bacterium]|nr:lysylphosphatidylglycerol synthase transmembrane domain-containing protein [Acidimicrobiales bacterium]